tara:strand:+ start:441 stop:710 length:270 start_codon:yes stop_codon:yes gene_type:complete
MGLDVKNILILNGSIKVDNVYINIRNITTTKEETNFNLGFKYLIYKDNNFIESVYIKKENITLNKNIWEFCYDLLKDDLKTKNLDFTDK